MVAVVVGVIWVGLQWIVLVGALKPAPTAQEGAR